MASTSIDDVCDEFACEPPNKSADPTPDDPLNWANFDCGESGDPIGSSPNKSAEEIAFAFLYLSLSTDFGDEYEDDDLKLRNYYVIKNFDLLWGTFFAKHISGIWRRSIIEIGRIWTALKFQIFRFFKNTFFIIGSYTVTVMSSNKAYICLFDISHKYDSYSDRRNMNNWWIPEESDDS